MYKRNFVLIVPFSISSVPSSKVSQVKLQKNEVHDVYNNNNNNFILFVDLAMYRKKLCKNYNSVSFTSKRKKYLGKGQLISKMYLQNIKEYL